MPDIHSVLSEIIGKRISELRKFNNDNQQQLADKIDIKRSSISNIELGNQQISLVVLYRICQVYNTEIYSLLPRVNDVGSLTKKHILELLK